MRPFVILAAALVGVLIWAKATEAYAINGVFIIACIAAGLIAFGIAEFLFSMRVKALNTENQQLRNTLSNLENEVTQVRKNRLESSNSNVAALEAYNKQLAQLQAENQQLETERRQVRERFTKMSEDLAKLEGIAAEKLKVQQALDDARQNIAELTNDNERLRLDLQMLHAELTPKVDTKTEEDAASSLVESLTNETTTTATPPIVAENVVAAILEEAKENTTATAPDNEAASNLPLERTLEMASLAAIAEQVEGNDDDLAMPSDANWQLATDPPPTKKDEDFG
jgi:DNA repair exonuclease SbcCD ATPase subunit